MSDLNYQKSSADEIFSERARLNRVVYVSSVDFAYTGSSSSSFYCLTN